MKYKHRRRIRRPEHDPSSKGFPWEFGTFFIGCERTWARAVTLKSVALLQLEDRDADKCTATNLFPQSAALSCAEILSLGFI